MAKEAGQSPDEFAQSFVKTLRPSSLLERFAGDAAARLIALLRFLLPISGGAAMHAA